MIKINTDVINQIIFYVIVPHEPRYCSLGELLLHIAAYTILFIYHDLNLTLDYWLLTTSIVIGEVFWYSIMW